MNNNWFNWLLGAVDLNSLPACLPYKLYGSIVYDSLSHWTCDNITVVSCDVGILGHASIRVEIGTCIDSTITRMKFCSNVLLQRPTLRKHAAQVSHPASVLKDTKCMDESPRMPQYRLNFEHWPPTSEYIHEGHWVGCFFCDGTIAAFVPFKQSILVSRLQVRVSQIITHYQWATSREFQLDLKFH